MASTKKDETRVRLFTAARRLLVERGFHGVGLEDIAAAAGVSRQAVYKSHFTSKADLLLALVQHVHVAHLEEIIRPVREATSAVAMFEETIRAIVMIEVQVHDLGMVLSAAAATDAGAAAAFRDRMEVKRGAIRDALKRLASEGRLNAEWELERAVDMLALLASLESYQQLVVEKGWTTEALIRKIVDLAYGSIVTLPKRRKK
jgi:AcrR family transcriptional regulator